MKRSPTIKEEDNTSCPSEVEFGKWCQFEILKSFNVILPYEQTKKEKEI